MGAPARPLMLFDGVCNLCNAAVQWVIDRDPEGRIQFASLQSEAARVALGDADLDAASRPDSFVLIDDRGLHLRSSAALGVARHLGFPYSMLAVGRVVPAPVRDAVYAWIARNRYRWFGRRDACMVPSPELASRFLDAGETAPATALGTAVASTEAIEAAPKARPTMADAVSEPSDDRGGVVGGFMARLSIAYILVYMAPFPLTLLGYIPYLGWIPGLYGRVMNPVIGWAGTVFFGVEAVAQPTGSGDMTFNYVALVVNALLAVAAAVIWTAAKHRRRLSPVTVDVSRTLARFYLGSTMLTYGWFKVFPLQFIPPGPDRLIQSYGDSSPMGLAWTFLGASVGYQIFAGLAELLGGYLLFWRRTALLGALFSAAVMTNVMAINFFYDVPVKLFSGHLVLVAIFIISTDAPRLAGLLAFNLPVAPRIDRAFWHRDRRRAHRVMALHLVFVLALTGVNVSTALNNVGSRGLFDDPDPLVAIYRVASFEQDGRVDRANEDTARWVRVGINSFTATIQRASGDAVRMRVAIDREAQTMSFFDRGDPPPEEPMFVYQDDAAGGLILEGDFEGAPTRVVLRKDETGALLVERGFRWINEYPFNR
jgi:predicted DCC family thiol-disulfide oxidoreductase YuxK